MAQSQQPDQIQIDLNMPVQAGWEAPGRLQGAPETAEIPVIALSAHAMTGDRERALDAGCDDYDTKPVRIDSLMTKIRALLPGIAEP
jgi:CheY-like chemotaxis protein